MAIPRHLNHAPITEALIDIHVEHRDDLSFGALQGDRDYEPVTDGSREIQRTWAQERNYLQGSASDWLPILDAAIRGIMNDCTNADWDGSGAMPVRIHTIELTAKIVETLFTMLPRGTPAPDLIPEADGEICTAGRSMSAG